MADRKTKFVPFEVYEGPCGIARESLWLTHEDLPYDRDTVVTIEEIRRRNNVEFTNETKKVALCAKFVGKERELLLNAGHREILSRLSGSTKCRTWFGLTIALFVDPDVKAFGKTVPGIRIRAKRLQKATGSTNAAKATTTPPPDEIVEPGSSQDDSGNTGSDAGS